MGSKVVDLGAVANAGRAHFAVSRWRREDDRLAGVGLLNNTEFILGTELPALGLFQHFRVGTGRVSP